MPKTLAEVLTDARDAKGLSLRDVERATGVHNAHVSQIEKGRIERPEIGLLYELAKLYELELVELLELAGHVAAGSVRESSSRAMTAAAMRAVGNLDPGEQFQALGYLQRLHSRRHQPSAGLSAESRHRIASIAERALSRSDQRDGRPTDLASVGEVAGVLGFESTSALPAEVEASKPSIWKRILGAVVFPTRVIYIDDKLEASRRRFTEAHETAHMLLPWHETAFLLDDERRLFYGSREELELEANLAAAHLIFQGKRYHERALGDRTSIRTAIDLAGVYDASMHASIRYYIEHHPGAVAGLAAGRYAQYDGTLPIWTTFESPDFLERFGNVSNYLPETGIPVNDPESVVGRVASEAFRAVDPPSEAVMLPGLDGRMHRVDVEAFFNQYTMFLMVSARRRVRPGRRTRLARSDGAA